MSDTTRFRGSVEIWEGLSDTDDGIKLGVNGEAFPRVHLTPQGDVKTGLGISLPTPLTGGAATVTIPSGLVANGVADDRAAIQATLDAVAAAGGGTVFLPKGTYLITRPLWLGSKVMLMGAGMGVTTITKPASIRSLLTANAAAGATSVTVADATGFVVGGPIHLADTSSYEWLSTQGVITNIVGNVITFTNDEGLGRTGVDGALQTTRSAFASTSFPLVRNIKGSTRIGVRDLTLNQATNAADPGFNYTLADFTLATIHWVETYYSLVENVELLNASGDAYSDQAQDGTGVTPAAGLVKTTKNTIQGSRIRSATRHAVHLGTCMNGALVLGNEMTNCGDDGTTGVGYGVFYCAFVTHTVVSGNLIEGCGQGLAGIDERDTNNVISANVIKGCRTWAIAGSGSGTGGRFVVVGNTILNGRGIFWTEADSTFVGNAIEITSGNPALHLNTTADRCQVVGNHFRGGTAGSVHLFLDNCDDPRVIGNTFRAGVTGASVRGVNRLVATGNHFSLFTTNIAWNFQVATSTDCVIKDERNALATPVNEEVAATRLVYEGLATNGTTDPAVSGPWFGITGRRFDGTLIYWLDGATHRVTLFRNGVGMINL